jgi:endoglucanase
MTTVRATLFGLAVGSVIVALIAGASALIVAADGALQAHRTPVAANGWLRTEGNLLVNERGVATQLRGVCTHGLQWFGDFYNDGRAIRAAATDWGADVVRIAVYLTEGGYLDNPDVPRERFEAWIDSIVRACVESGVYCILDWHVHHPGDPMLFLEDAKQFFDTMAGRYADLPNVIYEIANEPNATDADGKTTDRDVSWPVIKRYADEVIPVIRRRSPRALILVGTPDWCSFGISGGRPWQAVVNDPLSHPNVAYVVHYYAAAHEFHADIDRIAEQLPLFVTEWSAASYRRTSSLNLARSQPWIELLMRRRISWTYWNFAPGDGVFGAFLPETSAGDDLSPLGPRTSETGKLLYLLLNTPRDGWADAAPVTHGPGQREP